MGYRSDVAYTIRFKDEASYRLFILEAKANDLGDCFSNDTSQYEEARCDDVRLRIDFNANHAKWYESFPDVQMHEKLIEQAEAWCETDTHIAIKDGDLEASVAPMRLGFVFIRIGEDNGDVDERHGGDYEYEWLHVKREIIEG